VPGGDNVIRLLPPLTLTDDDIAEGIARLDRAATRLAPAA
jgi:acetylornithine/N-succinyldiaminopimelate aminotransferase